MARTPRWKVHDDDKLMQVDLSSWAYFDDFIRQLMLKYRDYVWRGHASATWQLEPTLDRILKKRHKLADRSIRSEHLQRFQLATRGRRGSHPVPINSENEWWALGQHYGLATPLLDWTRSPYVAAYFAFASDECGPDARRAVFGLPRGAVELLCENLCTRWKDEKHSGSPPLIEFIEPRLDENARLVNQGGVLTRAPDGVTIEDWIAEHRDGVLGILMKITIPDTDRAVALRTLNRMNINHLSLFPDVEGAAKFANLDLLIEDY